MQEAGTGFASKPQTDDAEPGDIALDSWVRYDAGMQDSVGPGPNHSKHSKISKFFC